MMCGTRQLTLRDKARLDIKQHLFSCETMMTTGKVKQQTKSKTAEMKLYVV